MYIAYTWSQYSELRFSNERSAFVRNSYKKNPKKHLLMQRPDFLLFSSALFGLTNF